MRLKTLKYNRVISIGDIHGSITKLKKLIEELKPTKEDLFIFLGDYTDRGEDSKATIDYLINFKSEFPESIFLRGNHDSMFLSFFNKGGKYGQFWTQNGGKKTLEDYGLYDMEIREMKINHNYSSGKIPESHFQFLKSTILYLETEEEFYSHAGFDCHGLDYDKQTEEEYTWTRENFIRWPHIKKLDKWVIVGHTFVGGDRPVANLESKKIYLDSHCYESGNLSALVLNNNNKVYDNFIETNLI